MERIAMKDIDCRHFQVDVQGSLLIRSLLQLFEIYGIPIDAGLYICDPTDPDKKFVIKRVEEREGG